MATTKRAEPDACSLLDADHRNVKKMFKEYETLMESKARNTTQKKRELADQICMELTVHAQIEEEIFYPGLRGASKSAADLLNEAEVEHASAKDLIAQIKDGDENDEKFDAKVTVLGEYIDHHVKEERNDIFPKARASKLDLVGMREQLAARKEELMSEMSGVSA
ncbi:MAG: hemerythrin domain-containing protein [Variovorax sp.]